MSRRALSISFSALPPRPHRLSQEQLQHVFGGDDCGGTDTDCTANKQCCSQKCEPYYSEIGRCK